MGLWLRPGTLVPYVPRVDRDQPAAEQRVFQLAVMTAADYAAVQDAAIVDYATEVRRGTHILELLRRGIRGWSGSGAPAFEKDAQGFEFKPASSSVPSLTLALFLDGIRHLLVGARGNVTFSAVVGEPGFMEFTFTGVYSSTTDVAMPTATYDTTVPPVFLGVGLNFHGFTPVFTTLDFDLGNVVEPRRNANDSLGAKSAIITGRSPTATVDPELDLVANFDFFGKLRDGSQGRFACSMGSTAGNKVTVSSPKCQIDGLAGGDRNGIATGTLTLNLATSTVNTGDDELQIGVL